MSFNNKNGQDSSFSFSHVGIFVKDIARMTQFYQQALQLFITDKGVIGGKDIVFLSQNPEEHHQLALVSGRPEDVTFSVINQISLRVKDLPPLRHYHASLKAAGAERIDPSTHGNALSIYSFDPEGNRIEVLMDTEWSCDQPLKETIDFSLNDDEIMARVKEIAQASPKFMPRSEWVKQMHDLMNAQA